MNRKLRPRTAYVLAFVLLFLIELAIALFVRDAFIRPYGGDMLVTVLLCCFVRILLLKKCRLLPLWVFLFAAAVELGQYFDFVDLLGLGESRFFRILLGSTFSAADLICYGIGCMGFYIWDRLVLKNSLYRKKGDIQ